MAGEIPGINQQAPQRPTYVDQASNLANAQGTTQKSTQAFKEVAALLGGRGVTLTPLRTDSNYETGKPTGATGIPMLDLPDDELAKEANLEKLIAYLQLDNDKRQAEMAKDRIETMKESLKSEHTHRMDKINDSLEKMEKAAKASKISRIFGWIGAIVSVIAAIATTVLTGGAAAGFAIAGAVLAVSSLIMSETGATDKLVEALAEHLKEEYGMSSKNAQLAASLIVNISMLLLGAGLSVGGMVSAIGQGVKASAETIKAVAKAVQTAVSISATGIGVGSIASSATTTALSYKSEMAKADVTELEKAIQELQKRLDESEEELNRILELLQNAIGEIADLINSQTDTEAEIANKISNMA